MDFNVINLHQDPAPLIHPLTAATLLLTVSSAARPRLCLCTSPSPSSEAPLWTAHLGGKEEYNILENNRNKIFTHQLWAMMAINLRVILFEGIYVAIKHNRIYHFLVFSLLFVILGMCWDVRHIQTVLSPQQRLQMKKANCRRSGA